MNKNTILSPQRHDDTASNIQRQTCNQFPLWLISTIHSGINIRGNGDHRRIPDHSAKPLRSSVSSMVNIKEQHSLRSLRLCGSIVVHNLANCGRVWWPGCERLHFFAVLSAYNLIISAPSPRSYALAAGHSQKLWPSNRYLSPKVSIGCTNGSLKGNGGRDARDPKDIAQICNGCSSQIRCFV